MKQLSIVDKKSETFVFVVHKHHATNLHYDLRLQIGRKMPSWAISKGPSLEPGVRRLAVQVNDHSLEYRNFEGVIPKGEVGGGPVMIWDEGAYIPEVEVSKGKLEPVEDLETAQKVMRDGLKTGQIKFRLLGSKLKGSFALVIFRPNDSKPKWLLIKHNDEFAKEGYDANDYDFSARTNRSLEEIRIAG